MNSVCKFHFCIYYKEHKNFSSNRRMEFLFTNQIASFESLAILLCLIIVASFYARDGYRWLMRVIGVLTPRKQYLSESKEESPSEQALAISEEKAEIIEEYLAEKSDTE